MVTPGSRGPTSWEVGSRKQPPYDMEHHVRPEMHAGGGHQPVLHIPPACQQADRAHHPETEPHAVTMPEHSMPSGTISSLMPG